MWEVRYIALITAVDRKKVCTHALLLNSSMLVMHNEGIVCMGYALVVECVDMWVIACVTCVCSCPNIVCRSQATAGCVTWVVAGCGNHTARLIEFDLD